MHVNACQPFRSLMGDFLQECLLQFPTISLLKQEDTCAMEFAKKEGVLAVIFQFSSPTMFFIFRITYSFKFHVVFQGLNGEEKAADSSEGLADKVAKHYNELPSAGKEIRKESPIYYLRNFNNWVKSIIINECLEKIKR